MAHSQQYQHQHQHQQPRKQRPSLGTSMPAFCDQITSSGAVIDIGSRFLWFSYHTLLYVYIQPNGRSFARAVHVDWRGHLSRTYHICVWTLNLLNVCHSYVHSYKYKSQWCDNPQCHGLCKAMELDIQLETEQCVRTLSTPIVDELPWNGSLELGQNPKELEAELQRIAPPNGRAILNFCAPCGRPLVRLEAWGVLRNLQDPRNESGHIEKSGDN
ncbi:hypothetical protein BDL97_07G113700 [Sphagnum fallax]|nr:hypothetical protein BDL97_07G113700 [Sphagnum fallax]